MKTSGMLVRSSALRVGLLLLGGGFALWMGFRLAMSVREGFVLRSELVSVQQAVSEQEVLYPLYVELQGRSHLEAWDDLRVPDARWLDEAAVLAAPERFKQMVEARGLELDPVLFRVETETGRRYLYVELPLRGAYRHLGALLEDVVRLEALAGVVRVGARHEGEVDEMRVEMKLGLE